MLGSISRATTSSCQSPRKIRPKTIGASTARYADPRARIRVGMVVAMLAELVEATLIGTPGPACCADRRPVQRLPHPGDGVEEPVVLAQRVLAYAGAQLDRDLRDDPAGTGGHHDHPVGEEHRLGDGVGDEDHRRVGLAGDPDQLVLHPLPGHLVQRAERLVHQQQPRALGQGAGDGDPLLHAAGQLVGIGTGELAQPDHLDQLGDPGPAGRRARAVELERQLDVGGDGAPRQQAGLLEGDPVRLVQPGLPRRAAEHLTGARRRGVEVGDQPQQGALAAAARPDQRDELTRAYVEVDVLQRDDIGAAAAGEDATDAGDVNGQLAPIDWLRWASRQPPPPAGSAGAPDRSARRSRPRSTRSAPPRRSAPRTWPGRRRRTARTR